MRATVPAVSTGTTRDVAIDVIRGLCIISMAFAHLAAGSVGWQVTHAAVWVDGAEGFVFLSGLVLGITQHRVVNRVGARAAAGKLLRRARLIYLGHLGLCVLAIVVVQLSTERAVYYIGLNRLGGPWPTAVSVLTLRVNPIDASILSLYVVMMLLAFGAVWLLRRGLWPAVLGMSLVLFGAGTVFPGAFLLTYAPGYAVGVNWATWQLLFMLALCAGWNWDSAGLQRLRSSRPVLLWSAVTVVGLAIVGRLATRGTAADWKSGAAGFFTDANLGIGRIVMGLAAVVVLYRLVRVALGAAPALLAPLATLGRRSLDCYLILSAVVVLLPVVVNYRRDLAGANLVVLAVIFLCWAWCTMRDLLRVNTLPITAANCERLTTEPDGPGSERRRG